VSMRTRSRRSSHPEKRSAVRRQFAEAEIEVIGMGTTTEFDSPDKGKLMTNMDIAMQHVKLSHEHRRQRHQGAPQQAPRKRGHSQREDLEQIGKSLKEFGGFSPSASARRIRLEVHGEITNLADIQTIMKIADQDNRAGLLELEPRRLPRAKAWRRTSRW